MAKSKMEILTEKLESGNYDLDSLSETDITVSPNAKSARMVSVERSLFNKLEKCARENKTTVNKLVNSLLKKSVLKAA